MQKKKHEVAVARFHGCYTDTFRQQQLFINYSIFILAISRIAREACTIAGLEQYICKFAKKA